MKKLIVLLCMVGAIGAAGTVGVNQVKAEAVDVAISTVGQSAGLSSSQIEELSSSLSDEDKQAIEDILVKNLSNTELIAEAASLAKNNDVSGLKNLVKENIDTDDVETLIDIYQRNADEIDSINVSEEDLDSIRQMLEQ